MRKAARCLLLLALFLPTCTESLSQEINTENEGAIILYDSIKITADGKKATMIRFHFDRSLKVKLNNKDGVESFRNVSLPESFDPALYIHSPKDRNTGKYLTNINIKYFNVRIVKEDGSVSEPEIVPDPVIFKSVDMLEDKYGEYQEYLFSIYELTEGDILELRYSYSMLYIENFFNLMTFRIFFHDNYPTLKKDLSFYKAQNLDTEINTFFCDDPVEKVSRGINYSWHLENLEGCMDESGIRPHKALPYVIISIMPDDMVYTVPYTFEERYIPFYVFGTSIREKRYLTIVRSMLNGVNSKQYNQVRSYIGDRIDSLPDDPTGYNQLYAVHNYIAENFEFDPDLDYFNRLDTRDEMLGDYLSKGVIRDRSRYNVYVALIAGLELNYFTAYLADKRGGVISEQYFEPHLTNDNLFAVMLKTDAIQFLYPKKDRFGYYLNELPFYFEDTKVRLIYLDDFRDHKNAIKEKFMSVSTPPSNSQDNIRTQTASVQIDLDERIASFDANISLSGQFSTLGRGAYLYNTFDETVNPQYYTTFWESISPGIEPESFKINSISQDFPFKADFGSRFTLTDAISKVGDTITLDLGGWFDHIVDDNLNAGNRVLIYYPDFKFTDTYNYLIEFNKKVKVIDRLPILEINNAYGSMVLKCVQNIDGSILLSSKMSVKAEKVKPENIHHVAEIQERIKQLAVLKVRMIVLE